MQIERTENDLLYKNANDTNYLQLNLSQTNFILVIKPLTHHEREYIKYHNSHIQSEQIQINKTKRTIREQSTEYTLDELTDLGMKRFFWSLRCNICKCTSVIGK